MEKGTLSSGSLTLKASLSIVNLCFYLIAELLRAKRASGAPWVRIFGKPMRPRKFGCVRRPPVRPRVQTLGEGEWSPKASRPGLGYGE